MKPVGVAAALFGVGALILLGFAISPWPSHAYGRWSQMMMGPMAGCPMGARAQGMMGPHMMGRDGRAMFDWGRQRGMMGPGHMMWWNQNAASISPRIESLHSVLAIRQDQQAAWDAYAAAARSDSQTMLSMHDRMVDFMQRQTTTAPDWLIAHRDMMRVRADSLDALAGAVDRLYAQLDAEQKAAFDRYGGGMCGAW